MSFQHRNKGFLGSNKGPRQSLNIKIKSSGFAEG